MFWSTWIQLNWSIQNGKMDIKFSLIGVFKMEKWTSNSALQHHGIKGQRWGIRNGPPYPIEDRVLKKGTKLNSLSGRIADSNNYKNTGRWMYTYREDDPWDKKVYRGPYARFLMTYRGAWFVREHEYQTVKDLKMPTKNERINEFKNLLNDEKYKSIVKSDIEKQRQALLMYNNGTPEQRKQWSKLNVNKLKTAEDYKTAYALFNNAMSAVHENKSTMEYARRMASKYDAMVDDSDQDRYNKAHDPIIIFRANEALKSISDPNSPHFVKIDEMLKNYKEVEKGLEKQGIRYVHI